jgi:2-polyprenyl-3-methyl-5-hydroxy-6-metoxy-1,4-benzoquinol methylase
MDDKDYVELNKCVACDSSNILCTLDLGFQPLANDFLAPDSTFEVFPLKLNRCKNCTHSQLSIAVNPSRLFRNYSYVSGTSQTLSDYFNFLVKRILEEFGSSGKVLDIGSNDGTFLSKFNSSKWTTLGVDPAVNLIESSISNGVITIPAFFNLELSKILTKDFDVIVAMNIFAHTANPLEVLIGINECLKINGKAYIQTSQANMFISGEFDTVYHEHISFFNVKSMRALLKRAGLSLSDVSIVPIHGGSYLWEITKNQNLNVDFDRELYENSKGFYDEKIYLNFAKMAADKSLEVKNIIERFRVNNYKIVSYGAAAKGNTFINFGHLIFDDIFDDTPQKIDKQSPAGGCLVSDPALLKNIIQPVLVVITAWNFSDEILNKIRILRNNSKDYYLVYFPEIILKPLLLNNSQAGNL